MGMKFLADSLLLHSVNSGKGEPNTEDCIKYEMYFCLYLYTHTDFGMW